MTTQLLYCHCNNNHCPATISAALLRRRCLLAGHNPRAALYICLRQYITLRATVALWQTRAHPAILSALPQAAKNRLGTPAQCGVFGLKGRLRPRKQKSDS